MDGKWSAIDSRTVHRHALTASYLYHAVLRGQLTARLGVAWTTPEKGIAEIVGIPADLLTAVLDSAGADRAGHGRARRVRSGGRAGGVPGDPPGQGTE